MGLESAASAGGAAVAATVAQAAAAANPMEAILPHPSCRAYTAFVHVPLDHGVIGALTRDPTLDLVSWLVKKVRHPNDASAPTAHADALFRPDAAASRRRP